MTRLYHRDKSRARRIALIAVILILPGAAVLAVTLWIGIQDITSTAPWVWMMWLVAACWYAAAACVVLLLKGLVNQADSNCRERYCVGCGYDLTGNESGVCPECGNPIYPEAAKKSAD